MEWEEEVGFRDAPHPNDCWEFISYEWLILVLIIRIQDAHKLSQDPTTAKPICPSVSCLVHLSVSLIHKRARNKNTFVLLSEHLSNLSQPRRKHKANINNNLFIDSSHAFFLTQIKTCFEASMLIIFTSKSTRPEDLCIYADLNTYRTKNTYRMEYTYRTE